MIAIALALAIPRETVLDSAAAYAIHEWTSTEANTEASCTSGYTSDYSPGTHVGLPYDWGGYVTLSEFDAQIAAGYAAGSHSSDGILECSTGVDCSGYLSKIWGAGHYTTSSFSDITEDIAWDDIERADGINDPGSHCLLFTHLSEGGWPVFYEASGSGEKVRINSSGGWSYVSGYQPIRYEDIDDGPSTGTAGEPREITAFPFTDYRWTAGAASDSIDSYSCEPGLDESGPEVLYRFEAATAGRLEAVVSDESGVDIDIHVLSAPDGESCVARDDTEISVEVGPGEVWLSLDTYVGGQEYPGPYILTATFDGALGDPPEEDTAGTTDSGTTDNGTTDSTGEDTSQTDSPPSGGDTSDRSARVVPGQLVKKEGGCGCGSSAPGFGSGVVAMLAIYWRRRTKSA